MPICSLISFIKNLMFVSVPQQSNLESSRDVYSNGNKNLSFSINACQICIKMRRNYFPDVLDVSPNYEKCDKVGNRTLFHCHYHMLWIVNLAVVITCVSIIKCCLGCPMDICRRMSPV